VTGPDEASPDGTGADELAALVADLARRGGLDHRQAYRLRLAADEITTNIAVHGYRGRPGAVRLCGGVAPDRVWLRVEDRAAPFDPRRRHRSAGPGGYGLLIVAAVLDALCYRHVAGRNRTTLIMWRHPRRHLGNGGSDDTDDRPGGR
jgi:anti-sigma regulatory factor (Ser/Thr protein kinase)